MKPDPRSSWMGDARERALAAGADGFIHKPCLPDELTWQILATLRLDLRTDA